MGRIILYPRLINVIISPLPPVSADLFIGLDLMFVILYALVVCLFVSRFRSSVEGSTGIACLLFAVKWRTNQLTQTTCQLSAINSFPGLPSPCTDGRTDRQTNKHYRTSRAGARLVNIIFYWKSTIPNLFLCIDNCIPRSTSSCAISLWPYLLANMSAEVVEILESP